MARVCCSKMMKEEMGRKQPKTYLSAVTKEFAPAPYGMCTSSSSQMKILAPAPVPSLSKEQLAEVEYIIQLKAHHDKIMEDKLLAHGKWLDNKMDNWMARFHEVWVEAVYNKTVLTKKLRNDAVNKKLVALQYGAALFVGSVIASAGVVSWLLN